MSFVIFSFLNHFILQCPMHRPLSMSENLTKSVQRIDFAKVIEESQSDVTGEEKDIKPSDSLSASEGKELATFQPSLWPWDSVRNKLK